MNWLKSLFQKHAHPCGESSSSQPEPGLPSGDGWQVATAAGGRIRQVAIAFPPSKIEPTDLGTLLLPHDKFPILASQPWCAGLFRVYGRPGPRMMVRMSSFAERAKTIPLTLGLTFCHMGGGGLFHVAARFDSPSFGAEARREISTLPPTEMAVAEWVTSLDCEFDFEMIADFAALPELRVVVCGDSKSSSEVMGPDGAWMRMTPPEAAYELKHAADAGLGGQLKREWEALAAHHREIPRHQKDFMAAQRELGAWMPADVDPVLAHP